MLFCRRMPLLRLREMTWTEVEALDRARIVALMPVGAIEAHGPHLPLITDGIIAHSMVNAAAARLEAAELTPLLLPPLDYSAAPFAASFPGTISIAPETITALLVDVAGSLAELGNSGSGPGQRPSRPGPSRRTPRGHRGCPRDRKNPDRLP